MIFITCALHCEAKPIIERYRLMADREAAFPVFKNEKLTLVVTGIGKLFVASAMSYVYARYEEPAYAAWLNIGVAGMKCATLGEMFNINKVTEKSTGTNWYPVRLPGLSEQKTCPVISLDEPDNNYTENDAYDMEASAFMLSALRFSPVELVQLVKVISDNEENAMQDVNKQQVTELISNNISQIDDVVHALLKSIELFKDNYDENTLYEQCLNQWRFSEYQKKQLSRMLMQWSALDVGAGIGKLVGLKSAKDVMMYVSDKLSDTDIFFDLEEKQ